MACFRVLFNSANTLGEAILETVLGSQEDSIVGRAQLDESFEGPRETISHGPIFVIVKAEIKKKKHPGAY